jgi:large subunit ribosomal protein L29
MKENADKARALDTAEIHKQLREGAEQAFRLRFQMSMGQMEGLKKVRLLQKDRARMLTVLRERELHPAEAAKAEADAKIKVKASKKAKASAKAKEKPKPSPKASPKASPKVKSPASKTAAPKSAGRSAAKFTGASTRKSGSSSKSKG